MIVKIDRETKIELLKALKIGYLDTANIPELNKIIMTREPARVLTKQEARELWQSMENEY
jgi:hypothetical protein